MADVPVGPGSRPTARSDATVPASETPVIGGLGSLQVLSRAVRYSRTESPRHYPDNDLVSVTRVAAWVHDVPGYGILSYSIGGVHEASRRSRAPRVAVRARTLENDA